MTLASGGAALLQVDALTVRFGGLVALNGFHLTVPKGGLIGLIGPNGAGKTTVFNLITGVYKPTSGRILFEEESIGGRSAHAIARRGIARTFQNIRLFAGLSVRENVVAATAHARRRDTLGTLVGWPPSVARSRAVQQKVDEILSLVGLLECADAEATSLPYGSQRKLEIARALMTEPRLLLLDEPAAGMNPTEKESLRKLVAQIAARGLGVLVIEHDMRFVMNLCTTITVLDHGEIICVGDPKTVQSHKAVIEAYLGVEENHGPA